MAIYIWGTGCGAGQLLDGGLKDREIAGFVDSYPNMKQFLGKNVISPADLAERDFELVIVSSRMTDEIKNTCEKLSIPLEKVLFLKNNYSLNDVNVSYEQAEKVLGRERLNSLRQNYRAVRVPDWIDDGVLGEKELENDYIRVKTLQSLTNQLQNVSGDCAELGVYRGSFARVINALMPQRRLYLFDSFQGFEERELKAELSMGHGGEGFAEAHRNTAVEKIIGIMPHPENVVIKQGWFPQSLEGLEGKFALVSLDADLEESTYEGLKYFCPRMSEGGYILLHDYNNPALPGVKNALQHWEKLNYRIPKLPLPDLMGTMVLCF